MTSWPVQDAMARFGERLEACLQEGHPTLPARELLEAQARLNRQGALERLVQ